MDGWIRSHPGRTVTIYDIAAIVAEAQLQAMSLRCIKAGFAGTGIYPYNQNLFTDADFATAKVTDLSNHEVTAYNNAALGESEPHDSDGHINGAAEDNAACQEQVQVQVARIHCKVPALA